MELRSDVVATLYAQGTAIALVLGLMIISVHLKQRKRIRDKLFVSLCINVLIMSVFLAINVLLRYRTFPGVRELALVCMTVSELSLVFMLLQWLIFVDYLIYKSWDHVARHFRVMFIPVMCEGVLHIVNLFTTLVFRFGLVFNVDEDIIYTRCPLFWSVKVIEVCYFITTIVMIVKYRKKSKTPVLIKISPFLIPLVIGSAVSVFTDYSAHSLGLAVGLVLLHFSFMSEYCYLNEEMGCYNKAYLEFMNRFIKEKSMEGGTGIVFEAPGNEKILADILLEEKPENTDLIYLEEGRFLLLTSTQRKSSVAMLIELIKEAAEEKKIEFRSHYGIRKTDEAPDAFISRVLAE